MSIVVPRSPGRAEELERMNSGYQARQFKEENEAFKQPQRERVAAFLLAHHAHPQLKLLSLPGLRWPFEHYLETCTDKPLSVLGLEWNYGTMELGRPYMLGGKSMFDTYQLKTGELHYLWNKRAMWVWTEAGSFLGQLGKRDKGSHKARRRFASLFKKRNVVWLDFTSNLCTETRRAVLGLPQYLDYTVQSVPFVITLLAAREVGMPDADLDSRADAVRELLSQCPHRRCDIKEVWGYTGSAKQPMMNIAGVLELRPAQQVDCAADATRHPLLIPDEINGA